MSPAARDHRSALAAAKSDYQQSVRAGRRLELSDWLAVHPREIREDLIDWLLLQDEFRLGGPNPPALDELVGRYPPADRLRVRRHLTEFRDATGPSPPSAAFADAPEEEGASPGGLSDFEIGEWLGEGGMGVVYLAKDRVLGREVAVKFLKPEHRAEPDHRSRMIREAKLQASLGYGIPAVIRYGVDGERRPFIVMTRIVGEEWNKVLPRGGRESMPPNLSILLKVAEIVGFAHSLGLSHRDLKPANVVVGSDGRVWVVDWGIGESGPMSGTSVQELEADSPRGTATRGGVRSGTPCYMAPEQAVPRPGSDSKRTDVFLLGGLLCEVLTGKATYLGDETEAIVKATAWDTEDAFHRLDACGADGELIGLCKRCLSARPEDRPANGAAVAKALIACQAAVVAKSRASDQEKEAMKIRAEEDKKRVRIRRWLRTAVATLVIGAGVVGWKMDRQRQAEDRRVEDLAKRLQESLDRSEAALRADDPATASAAVDEVVRHPPDAGGEAIRSRLARGQADLRLLQDLQRIDDFRWMPGDGGIPEPHRVAKELADACGRFGVAPGTAPPQEVAERVKNSPVGDRLLGALELWLVCEPSKEVRAILSAADPDGYREGIRDAVLAGDAAALEERVWLNAAFAQPQRFVAVFGRIGAIPDARRREVLGVVHGTHPRDLTALMELAGSHPFGIHAGAKERVALLRQAVPAHPNRLAVRHNLGLALRDAGNPDEALREFRAALDLRPDCPLPHEGRGNAFADKKQYDDAIREFRAAVALDKTFAAPHTGLGKALVRKSLTDEAILEFRIALALDPRSVAAYDGLLAAYQAKGDLPGAVREFQTLVERDATPVRPRNGLGNAFALAGNLEGATWEFRAAIRLDKTFAPPHHGLGKVHFREGNWGGAIAKYEDAITADRNYALAHQDLGTVLWERNHPERALRAFEAALALDPRLAAAHYGLGVALSALGPPDRAITEFRAAIDLDKTFAAPHHGLGIVLLHQGKVEFAVEAFRAAIARDGKAATQHQWLGHALLRAGNLGGAADAYRAAIACDGKFAPAHVSLGNALAEQGDLVAACREYQDARDLDRSVKLGYGDEGNILLAAGDRVGAVAAYRKAVRDRTPWPHVYRNLARLLAEDGKSHESLRVLEGGLDLYPKFVEAVRFDLARYACRAASGRDPDAPPKRDEPKLYRDALAHLTAELAAQRAFAGDPQRAKAVHQRLLGWLVDPALESSRSGEMLPEGQREGWKRLWADIRKLRDDTAPAK